MSCDMDILVHTASVNGKTQTGFNILWYSWVAQRHDNLGFLVGSRDKDCPGIEGGGEPGADQTFWERRAHALLADKWAHRWLASEHQRHEATVGGRGHLQENINFRCNFQAYGKHIFNIYLLILEKSVCHQRKGASAWCTPCNIFILLSQRPRLIPTQPSPLSPILSIWCHHCPSQVLIFVLSFLKRRPLWHIEWGLCGREVTLKYGFLHEQT